MENLIIALVILLLLAMIVGLAMGAMVLWRKLSPPSKAEGPAYAAPGAGPCGFEREAPSKSPPGEQALEESRGLPAEARGFSPAKIAGPFAPMTPKSRLWSTRLAAVAVLTVLMTIPMLLIGGLVGERRETMLMTTAGLSDEWGPSQTLTGPLLAIPMTMTVESAEMVPTGENSFKKARLESRVVRWALLTPKTLEANQTLAPEMRRRGIYSSLVYTAEADLSGTFALPSASDLERLPGLSGRLESIGWDQARILVGITSSKSLRAAGPLSFGGRQYEFKPGASELPDAPKGFSAEVDLSRGAPSLAFAFKLSFGGSSAIRIAPVADANQIGISSSWPHPSFAGATLPAERSVSENGFSAKWRVPSMARSYQSLRLLPEKADNNEGAYGQPKPQTTYEAFWVGVSLIDPVDGYHRVDRAVKYAMIFISLNFLIFLLWERSLGRGAIHPVQYAVIGLAEALFYLVLLALFEHVGFGAAYLAASALDVAMVGGYSLAVTGRRLGAAVVSLLLTMLHAVLYVILSLEDYALLAGTALLVIALAAVMIATRKLGAPAPGEEGLSGPGGPPPGGAPPKSAEAPDEPASPKAPLMEPQGAL